MKNKNSINLVKSNKNFTDKNKINKSQVNYDLFCELKLKEKFFKIYCGDGKQKLSWLTDIALFNYERKYGFNTGNFDIK